MAQEKRPTTNWKKPNSPKIQRQLQELMQARKTTKPKSAPKATIAGPAPKLGKSVIAAGHMAQKKREMPLGAKIAKTVVRTATKVASTSVPGTALKVAKAAGRALTSSNAKPGTIAGPRPGFGEYKEKKTGRVSKGDMKKFREPAPRPKKKTEQKNMTGKRTFSATSTATKPRSMPSKKMNSR